MKYAKCFKIFILAIAVASFLLGCEPKNEDFTGTYCLNLQNMEMIIVQTGDQITFSLNNDLLENGTGTVSGYTLALTAIVSQSEVFTGKIIFSEDGESFSGPFNIVNSAGDTTMVGTLIGNRGECKKFDITANGIPQFVETDLTRLSTIEKISKFRSGFGHSFTDGSESCRSMKHYFNPYPIYRQNNTVEIYSPVNGVVVSVVNDGHGESNGLTNKEIQIRPDDQPAFVIVLYHCDLVSEAIVPGKKVSAGDLVGHARMYYDDLDQYSTSFDIAVWVNTPSGMRLISYFETMKDVLFSTYISRGVTSRKDFIITTEERNADPLQCNGETFLTAGNIVNFVTLF
jgi:hypothetical protein